MVSPQMTAEDDTPQIQEYWSDSEEVLLNPSFGRVVIAPTDGSVLIGKGQIFLLNNWLPERYIEFGCHLDNLNKRVNKQRSVYKYRMTVYFLPETLEGKNIHGSLRTLK